MSEEKKDRRRSENGAKSPEDAASSRVEIVEAMTGEILPGDPLPGEISVDTEVAKAAMESMETISSNAASVDEAQLKADAETSKAALDAFREALAKAETREEREKIYEHINNTDERQKRNSESSGGRSANTQRGSMLVIHSLVLATAAVAVAGAFVIKSLND